MKYTPEHCYLTLLETFVPKETSSETTKSAWKYVLKNVNPEILKIVTQHFLETWTTEPYKPRIPSQADFLQKCKEIESDMRKLSQPEIEEPESKPLSKKEAAKLYSDIIKKVSTIDVEETVDSPPELTIYETYSPNTQKYFYVCHGHVAEKDFINSCYKQFAIRPDKVVHYYQKFKTIIKKNGNGKVVSTPTGYVKCLKTDKGAEKFTAGH